MQNNKTNQRINECSNYPLVFDESVVHKQLIKFMIHTFSNVALLIVNPEALTVLPNSNFIQLTPAIPFTIVTLYMLMFVISSGPTEAPDLTMWMQKHFRDWPYLLVTVNAYKKVYDISIQLCQ